MKDGLSWSQLTYKQKYDYGVWIVASIGSVIVTTLCAVIVCQNNDLSNIRKDCEKKIVHARMRDSIENQQLKVKLEKEQDGRIQDIKDRRIVDSIWLEKYEKLSNEKK